MLRSNSTRSGECAESAPPGSLVMKQTVSRTAGILWSWLADGGRAKSRRPTDRRNFRLALIHLVFMICLSLCLSVSREFLQQQQQLLHANSRRVTSFLIRHYCIPIYTVGLLTAELLAVSEHCRNSLWQNSVTLSSSIKTLTECK